MFCKKIMIFVSWIYQNKFIHSFVNKSRDNYEGPSQPADLSHDPQTRGIFASSCPWSASGGCHPYLRNVSAFSVNFHLNRWRYSHVTFLANHTAMFLGPWACGSECCSSNSNAPDISQKGLIGIQSHHSREKMSKKAREKPAKAGSASVSPYGSVLGYELVTSQPNRLINLIWPECRTWFIGPWISLLCRSFVRMYCGCLWLVVVRGLGVACVDFDGVLKL